jgi:hypothetical protein
MLERSANRQLEVSSFDDGIHTPMTNPSVDEAPW